MYNDYYLQEINNKLTTTNNKLNEIISNQTIIDNDLQAIITNQSQINNTITLANLILMTILLLIFFIRSLK